MNQVRKWTGKCQVCGIECEHHTMSLFDVSLICMQCSDREKQMRNLNGDSEPEADSLVEES